MHYFWKLTLLSIAVSEITSRRANRRSRSAGFHSNPRRFLQNKISIRPSQHNLHGQRTKQAAFPLRAANKTPFNNAIIFLADYRGILRFKLGDFDLFIGKNSQICKTNKVIITKPPSFTIVFFFWCLLRRLPPKSYNGLFR